MRLYTVFELLVIALLIAFGASSVINGPDSQALLRRHRFSVRQERQDPTENVVAVPSGPNKYCTCSSLTCNCCRDFALPVVPIKGPGCATVSYVSEDKMKITMSFGDRVLRDITVNSKKPKPICMGMPGGISKFCGRLYSIKKDGEHFKACLGLELRALDDVEAALRVSCFRFGPGGVNVEPGEAIPGEKNKEDEDEDDDDDYGLGEFDDDDDDDDDDFGLTGGEDDGDDEENEKPPAKQSTYNDVDSSDDSDYTGLGTLSEELFGGLFGSTKKRPSDDDDDDDDEDDDEEDVPLKSQVQNEPPKAQPQVNLVVMNPVIVPTQTVLSPKPVQRRPVKKPAKNSPTTIAPKRSKPVVATVTTPAPLKTLGTSTTSPVATITEVSTAKPKNKKKKKPSRRRRPTSPKPTSSTTEATPIVVTTMTVNVVQGSVNLNESTPQQYQKPNDNSAKVPMTKPIIETKPIDTESVIKNSESSPNTEAPEVTTQTFLQNTIPVDEVNDVKLHPVSVFESSMNKPDNQENYNEDETSVDTTERVAEATTNQASTIQEPDGYTHAVDDNLETTAMEEETTESVIEEDEEMTMEDGSDSEERDNQEIQTTLFDRMDVNPATESYDGMAEATDKTETIIHTASSVEEQRDSKEDEDDDDDDIDIGADFGLDDDDDDEEEEEVKSKKKEPIKIEDKPEEKDDDDDDIFGGMLDDEDDEDENTRKGVEEDRAFKIEQPYKKEVEEDRAFKIEQPYKINPLLFRIARVSAGNVATGRHWPRFSEEGRNRRNNKRMRFPSLEITS